MEVKTTAEITAMTITNNNKEWAKIRWVKVEDIEKEFEIIIE